MLNKKKHTNSAISDHDHQAPPPASISIFGLGYVGVVSAACLTKLGHNVVGVDTNPATVDTLNKGQSPIVEKGLGELLMQGVTATKLMATQDVDFAIRNSNISFVCVGTSSAKDGSLDLTYLKAVSAQIGESLKDKAEFHTVVFRSIMGPGTTENILTPIIEKTSGKTSEKHFSVCFHPEFLREGTAIDDFFTPQKTVVGSTSKEACQAVADIYGDIFNSDTIFTTLEVAEMFKYVDNPWHAIKVSFANEIGRICQSCQTDGHEVMDIFCKDRKLNLSPYYLKPGFAFGGSCLPKDVRGINKLARNAGIETPLLNSIIKSNYAQINHAAEMVKRIGNRKVAILGITFKKDTDDLRETPIISMITSLLASGYSVKVFDENIKSKRPLMHYLQHAECADEAVVKFCNNYDLYKANSLAEVLRDAETIVVTHDSGIFQQIVSQRKEDQTVVDLVRLFQSSDATAEIQQAGMNSFLQKPVAAIELDNAIKNVAISNEQGGKRVLLAEDNIPMNTVIQAKLSRLGYIVDTVTNGEDAVYMAISRRYDAILMDLEMPKLNGMEATRQIRCLKNENSSVPIIALSANATAELSKTYHGLCW